MSKNRINDQYVRVKFASVAQDIWHYSTLISPIKGAESTFAGSRGYLGLPGMLSAYESLITLVEAWQLPELPAFESIELIDADYITTTGELRHQARIIFRALEKISDDNQIDAYNGTFKHASIPNLV